jgi:hypothetical protein
MKLREFAKETRKVGRILLPELVTGKWHGCHFILCDPGAPGSEAYVDTSLEIDGLGIVRAFVSPDGWVPVTGGHNGFRHKSEENNYTLSRETANAILRKWEKLGVPVLGELDRL